MKLNNLLIFCFYALTSFIPINGMNYLERAKSYFTSSDQQIHQKEFKESLEHSKYRSAFDLFKTIYPQSNSTQKNVLKKIIVNIAEGVPSWSITDREEFIQLFLKPALEIEPNLYNDIFNRIAATYFYFNEAPSLELLFTKNIHVFSDVFSPFQQDKVQRYSKIWNAFDFLIFISTKDTNLAEIKWLQLYFDNLDKIYKNGSPLFDLYFIHRIGYNKFVDYLVNHMDSILHNHHKSLIKILKSLARAEKNFAIHPINFKQQSKNISSIITQNIMLFNNNPDIAYLFSDNPSLLLKDISLPEIVAIALSHIKELSPEFAVSLLFKSQSPQLAQAIISAKLFSDYLIVLAREILGEITSGSPTSTHLKEYRDLIKSLANQFYLNTELKDVYITFRQKEQELNKQGYYTFVHGQQRRFYFPEKLYTHLWGLRKKQSVESFLFAHVKDLIETEEAQFEEDIARKTIHMAGAVKESQSHEIEMERRKKVLFMNYAFFANAQNAGSNSAGYVISNANSPMGSQVQVSVQEPFTLLGYDWIYKKHQQEIDLLAQDYLNLSQFGNMLLIAIPKDKIYKYVYLCRSGGLQKPLVKKDGTQITDIRIAMETLLENPESLVDSDKVEFCLIMTQVKGGLDPSTGIQIYPLLSGDPQKLKALQEREKILLDKITADVKEAEKQQALERAAKITGHVVESAQAK